MLLLTNRTAVALMHPVIIRMVLLFLPAVTMHATVFKVTAVAVSSGLLFCTPETTLLLADILVNVWLAAIVLPVMRILTLIAHMTPHFVIERTPDCLEVEHVEVIILLHLMKQVNGKFFFAVCKSAEIAEVARVDTIRPSSAELCLVFLRVVK